MGRLLLFVMLCCAMLSVPARGTEEISPSTVRDAVSRFVQREVSGRLAAGERVETHVRWRVPIRVQHAGPVRLEISRLSSKPLKGPTVLRMRVFAAQEQVGEMSVTADVRRWRPVVVAVRGMRRGEKLRGDLVEVEERDVTQVRGHFYTAVSEVDGLRMRRTIRGGEVLTDRITEPIPVIGRGATVEMVVRTANLRVTAPGVALQDGAIGARIRVRNTESGSIVYGRVIDSGRVRVELP